ncbi:MAG: class I SAM-dependent methyltransferase [Acidobacteria bacterium]|nr:class I SAM-dependent methyltransferase [Acidobacteriota bacterium]
MSSKNQLLELQQTLYTSNNPTRRWLHCSRRDWIIDAIRRYRCKNSNKALEVGPGSGLYLPILANLFREVTAADIEENYLNHARTLTGIHPNLSMVIDDITCSRLPEHSFDLILCTEVVEHIADSASAIAAMHRLLRPGGFLILSTPQRYSSLEITARIAFLPGIINLVKFIYREPVVETGHINLMTCNRVSAQLRRPGFKVREQFKSGVYLPLVAEFAGNSGLRLEQWLEPRLRNSPLDWVLWTQYFVAEA